jgi:hypothetical protein
LKKRTARPAAPQKLFAPRGWGVFNTARSGAKVFWLLFFKKVTAFLFAQRTLRNIAGIRAVYIEAHGRAPNLLRPRRYTEKMQWRKLFDRNPTFPVLCDKLAVRDFIYSRIGARHLPELLWYGLPVDIPFDTLAPPYVLKSTHGSGQVMMFRDGQAIDADAVRACAAAWLAVDHAAAAGEPAYASVPRRLVIERMIAAPLERRLFVFQGKVAVINTVFVEADRLRNGAFHTPAWEALDWHFTRVVPAEFARPECLAEMIAAAEQLGAGLDHVRVDIYDCGGSFLVGEITLYSWSGLARFNPDSADFALGAAWVLERPMWRAITAIFARSAPR